MTLEKLIETYPKVEPYIKNMPSEIKSRCTIRTFMPGCIIHQKQFHLDYFGIVCDGDHRVINEFENGDVFMIEKNEAVDFIGEVTILAQMKETSVTIEALTQCTVLMLSRKDFENWISQDIEFLRMVAHKVAFKLYRSSSTQGAKLFYPPNFLLLEYLLRYCQEQQIEPKKVILIKKTRPELYEELGMSVKTINRTIDKLKAHGLVTIEKGKMVMDFQQYERGKQEIKSYLK